jgi:hypothetical protein
MSTCSEMTTIYSTSMCTKPYLTASLWSPNFLWGFNNGIYRDQEGRSRSSIGIFKSADGINWDWASDGPVVFPEGEGWKKALVYAMDPKLISDKELLLYFNSRSGWFIGAERIGLATGRLPT